MTTEERERILVFLREPVPPSYEGLLAKWKERAGSQGPLAPALFVERLREGGEGEQYASLLALRQYGYEAWGNGYGSDFHYTVCAPGESVPLMIRPSILPA